MMARIPNPKSRITNYQPSSLITRYLSLIPLLI
jgi:hypothetical protein